MLFCFRVEREVRSVMGTLPRSVYSIASPLLCSTQMPLHPKKKTKLQLAEEKYGARQRQEAKIRG